MIIRRLKDTKPQHKRNHFLTFKVNNNNPSSLETSTMSSKTLDNATVSLQNIRKPIYDIVELCILLFNSFIMCYGLLHIKTLYLTLGMGFLAPILIGPLVCCAPLLAVRRWRKISLLYDRTKNAHLLERIDLDAPNRHMTLLGGAIWTVASIGLILILVFFIPDETFYNIVLDFLIGIPFILLGPMQVSYILITNKIHQDIITPT